MPNTPARVGQGMTALQSDTGASKEDIILAETIFSLMGEVVLIEGDKFDAVTALSGSGPAYFFHIAEIMASYAQDAGFSKKQADIIAFQTMLGAARLMKEEYKKDGKTFGALREEVTSPGGTTEAALKSMDKNNLGGIFKKALDAALSRSKEISKGDK
jgi:pyrroline-5-carboxylate reductase